VIFLRVLGFIGLIFSGLGIILSNVALKSIIFVPVALLLLKLFGVIIVSWGIVFTSPFIVLGIGLVGMLCSMFGAFVSTALMAS